MICIICQEECLNSPIEHIVPESLGNKKYVLAESILCAKCNNRFSEFESKAITKSILSVIRIQQGIKTKKGKPSRLKSGDIEAVGSAQFEKGVLEFEKLNEKDIDSFDTISGSYKITIPNFDGTEMSAVKMILKIGFQSLYKSKKEIFGKYQFADLKDYLTNRNNRDWPFIDSHNRFYSFQSIPTFDDKYTLSKIKCRLSYAELSKEVLLFEFQYDYFLMTVNLLNRDYSWAKIYFDSDQSSSLYPRNLKKI